MTEERRYSAEEIEAAKAALQRRTMIQLGGQVGLALISGTASEEDAIAYIEGRI